MIAIAALLVTAAGGAHIRVDGDGYFRMMRDGQPVYAREADLAVISGRLGSHGATFLPAITVSKGVSALSIDLSGHVLESGSEIGHLVLALPTSGSQPLEDGFVSFTDRPRLVDPGDGTAGVIRFSGAAQPTPVKAHQELVKSATDKTQPPHKAAPLTQSANTDSASGKLEVIVHAHSMVGEGKFGMADVAEMKGPADLLEKAQNIIIADAPALGVRRLLDEHSLSVYLMGAGLSMRKVLLVCPQGADVVRKSQTIDPSALVKAATDAVVSKFGGSIPLVMAQKIAPFPAPEGEVTYEASGPEAIGEGYYVAVTVKVAGNSIGIKSLTLVPSKDAPRAKVNDPVTVILLTGNAAVEVPGKIKTAGYVGQRVEVIVEKVGAHDTTHIGTLVAPNKVEVQL